MGRVFFFIAEAFRALRRSAAPSLAAIVTVVLTTLLLGVFIPVIKASSTTNENVRSAARAPRSSSMSDATQEAGEGRRSAKIDAIPHVARTEYISKDAGPEDPARGRREGPTQRRASASCTGNPLPPSINVHPDDPDNLDSIQAAITPPGPNGKPKPISPAIDNVSDGARRRRQDPHRDQRGEDHPAR